MIDQTQHTDFDAIIIGGGLAGLVSAILLSKTGKNILLVEKRQYPFHKVCGEYVSNEVLEFLRSIGFDPYHFGAASITRLRISDPSGKNITSTLDLAGFGLSRYIMDNALYQLSVKNGTQTLTSTKVNEIKFQDDRFTIKTNTGKTITSKIVLGSYGKRDVLDKKLHRDFIRSRTGYMGVKYHIRTDYPVNEVGLDNFKNGYCGIVKIEEDKYNLCYLFKRNKNRNFGSIPELEKEVLFENPVIRNIFSNAEFIFEQPEVINEISFAHKTLVEDHILMCGDSAGLITPLCGNGMSMAIHSAKLLSDLIIHSELLQKQIISVNERKILESEYQRLWNKNFSRRLFWGRTIQHFFGNKAITGLTVRGIHSSPKLEHWLIAHTHGQPLPAYSSLKNY